MIVKDYSISLNRGKQDFKSMEEVSDISLKRATSVKRESRYVEFIEKFDPNQAKDWCEIIKEVVAMANSGRGIIVIGVRNDGSSSGEDVSGILRTDPAQITDKIAKYTGEQFDKFAVQEADRNGCKIAVLEVDSVSIPMVFTQPGTYGIGSGKSASAFAKGSVYFRHGAKSEPGNTNDLRKSLERELTRTRKSLLKDIRKVIHAPIGHQVKVLPPGVVESELPSVYPIRIVDDLSAPAYRPEWDESAYQSPRQIVVGALKSWKRDRGSYASESDMWTLYAFRNDLQLDEEKAECLLESAINRYAPFFFFAQFLSIQYLIDFVKRVSEKGKYPAPFMVVKLAYVIGGRVASELLDHIEKYCNYLGVQTRVNELKKTVLQRNRIEKIYRTHFRIGKQYINVEKAETSFLEALMATAIKMNNKEAIKNLDAFLYGPILESKVE